MFQKQKSILKLKMYVVKCNEFFYGVETKTQFFQYTFD